MAFPKRIALIKKEPALAAKSDLLLAFLEEYIDNGGKAQEAWVTAGYAESTKKGAMAVARKEHSTVQKLISLKIGSHVPSSIQIIVDLMSAEKTPAAVKLKCAQDILSRAGYDAAIDYTITEKPVTDMTNSELDTELTKLLGKAMSPQATSTVEH
jgi:hypothetical protein|tara:strand:- start:594 stop:1058 length:465 start_codon:yes stop_codon:yes gene_type:complete